MTFRAYLAEEAQGLKRELEVYRRVLGDARMPWLPKPCLASPSAMLSSSRTSSPVIGHLDEVIIVPVLVIVALRLLPGGILDVAGHVSIETRQYVPDIPRVILCVVVWLPSELPSGWGCYPGEQPIPRPSACQLAY
jgi:hypothetical protein